MLARKERKMAAQMVLNDELFVMKQQLQNIENLLVENNKYGLSVKEAARYSGIGRTQLYRLMESGELDYKQVTPQKRIITKKALNDYLER